MRRWLLIACVLSAAPARADDARAFRLYRDGRMAEAAELFDDTAWKGIALYQSGQVDRAVRVFAKGRDAASLHNLGNGYLVLGYPSLAIDAYQRALQLDPASRETRENLAMVLEDMKQRRDRQEGAAQPEDARIIATIDKDNPGQGSPPPPDAAPAPPAPGRDADEPRPESGDKPGEAGGQGQAAQGGSGSGADKPPGDGAPGSAEGEAGKGEAPKPDRSAPASGPESGAPGQAPPAAQSRALAEAARATEQWLAAIADQPGVFAARRIGAESARRRSRSGPLPEAADPW